MSGPVNGTQEGRASGAAESLEEQFLRAGNPVIALYAIAATIRTGGPITGALAEYFTQSVGLLRSELQSRLLKDPKSLKSDTCKDLFLAAFGMTGGPGGSSPFEDLVRSDLGQIAADRAKRERVNRNAQALRRHLASGKARKNAVADAAREVGSKPASFYVELPASMKRPKKVRDEN